MTDKIEESPELVALIWDNLIADIKGKSKEAEVLYQKLADETKVMVLSLFASFFAKHPEVLVVAWSQTTEEYNDENYGGYEFLDMRPRFDHDKLTKEELEWVQAKETDWNGHFVDTDRYYFAHKPPAPVPPRLQAALDDVNEIDSAVRGRSQWLCQTMFGTEGVYANRKGIHTYDPDDMTINDGKGGLT